MLKINEDFYKNMLENIYEGVYFVANDRKITFWNKGAEKITGFKAEDVMNHFCYDNILNHINDEGVQLCVNGCPLHHTILTGEEGEVSVYLHHKEGHRVPVSVKAVPIYDEDKIIGAVEIFTDDSDKQQLIKDLEELRVLAMVDQLTELPNRRYLDMQMYSKMNEYIRFGVPFGIVFFDIDFFKRFNDSYGHEVGDEVLKMVARTLKHNLRSNDLVGRWGGEEFLVIIQKVNDESLLRISQKIRTLVEKSVLRKSDIELSVTISIGATVCKENDTIESMLKRADELLYQSKANGRNQVTLG